MLFACPQGAAQKEKIATKWKGFVMPKSSIHIKVGNVNFVIHSTRNNFSYSVVFLDEKNEHLRTAKEALKIYREELAKRSLAYSKRTGQKLQKNVATILSAVVNLEQHHTLKDLQPILQKLEKDLDTKIISCSIHRDEGTLIEKSTGKKYFSGEDFALNRNDGKLYWIDEKKNFLKLIDLSKFEVKKNYHAHIEFMGLDSEGKAIKRNRLNRHYLSALQDFVASTLQMERGRKLSKAKHKDPHEFKKEGVIKREVQADLEKKATIKALKEINKQIRAQLQEKKAQRPHYAKWESYYKELQEYVKSEKPTMGKVMERISEFVGELLEQIQQKEQENFELLKEKWEDTRNLEEELEAKKQRVKDLEEKLDILENEQEELEQLKEQMQAKEKELLEKIQEKSEEILSVEKKKQELLEQIKEKEEEIEHKNKTIEKLNNDVEELKQQVKAKEQELLSDMTYQDGTQAPWSAVAKHYRKLYEELKPKYSNLKKQKEEERKRREKAEEKAEELKNKIYSNYVDNYAQEHITWQELAEIYKEEKERLKEENKALRERLDEDQWIGRNRNPRYVEKIEAENQILKEENGLLKKALLQIAQELSIYKPDNLFANLKEGIKKIVSRVRDIALSKYFLEEKNKQLEEEIQELKGQNSWKM